MQIMETFKILNKLKNVFEKKEEIDKLNQEEDTDMDNTQRVTEYQDQLI